MNFFEVRSRLESIEAFRRHYLDYVSYTNRESNVAARVVLERLKDLKDVTVDSLSRAGLGAVVTRDAPSKGRRQVRINVVKAIFRPNIIRRFAMDDDEPLEFLDKGIFHYRTLFWKSKLQLFNPVFWLFQVVVFIAELPLWIFSRAGYDTSNTRRSATFRTYLVLFQFGFFFLIARWLGLTDWMQLDMLALQLFR